MKTKIFLTRIFQSMRMKYFSMKFSFLYLPFILFIFTGANGHSQDLSRESMQQHLKVLTSDSLAGRRSGSEDERKAALYIRDYFRSLGLELLAEDGIQPFEYTGFGKKELHSQNVVARLEGSDPELKKECIIIGGHYDHLGNMGLPFRRSLLRGGINFGADDNASGTVMVMELARYYAAHRGQCKRSIVFVAFGSEEQGLWGSKKFTSAPPEGTGKMMAMLNFDMVGRMDTHQDVFINGIGTASEMADLLSSLPNPDGMNLVFYKTGKGPTDSESFYLSGVPVVSFITGLHRDYHTPRDVESKINYTGMLSIGHYAINLVDAMENPAQQLSYTKNDDAYPKSDIEIPSPWQYTGHLSGIHFGFGGLLNENRQIDAPAGYSYLKTNIVKSSGYGITLFSTGVKLVKTLGITTGLGLGVQQYGFEGNVPIRYSNGSVGSDTSFVFKNISLDRNALRTTSLYIPVMLEIKSREKGPSAYLSFGIIGSVNLGTRLMLKYEEEDHRVMMSSYGKYGLNTFNYALSVRAGYGRTGFFVNYQPASVFKSGNPVMYPFLAGISLNFKK